MQPASSARPVRLRPHPTTHSPEAGQGPYLSSRGSIQNAGHSPAPGLGIAIRASTRMFLCVSSGTKAALDLVWMRPLVTLPPGDLRAEMCSAPPSTRTLAGSLV